MTCKHNKSNISVLFILKKTYFLITYNGKKYFRDYLINAQSRERQLNTDIDINR